MSFLPFRKIICLGRKIFMSMSELEVIATFDAPQTARNGAKLLNSWFSWIMDEESTEYMEDIEDLFDFFGLSPDDFSIDEKNDIDWQESPEVHSDGNDIIISLSSKTGLDTIIDLLGAMGAYDVNVRGEEA
jgi:hypothetical protein